MVEFLRDYIEPLFQDMAPAGVGKSEYLMYYLNGHVVAILYSSRVIVNSHILPYSR